MVSEVITGVVIGGLLTLGSGIVLAFSTKYYEDNRNKRFTAGALLGEVKENQYQLTLLINGSSPGIQFSRTLYCALLDRVALLHPDTIENLVGYYAKLEIIEQTAKINNAKNAEDLGDTLIENLDKDAHKGLLSSQKAWIKNFLSKTKH